MSEVVKCDGCGTDGHRRMDRFSPEGWLYLEAHDNDNPDNTLIILACSKECALEQWNEGPGNLFATDDDAEKHLFITFESNEECLCMPCARKREIDLEDTQDVCVWEEGSGGWLANPGPCDECGKPIEIVLDGKDDDDA